MLNLSREISARFELAASRINSAKHIQISEAIIDRRHNRIGHKNSPPRERRVMPADINDDEAVPDPRHAKLFFKFAFILLRKHDLLWSRQIHPIFSGTFQARPKRAVERQLPQIDIKRGDTFARIAKRDAGVKR